jgi:hypothetical protein
VLGAGVCGCWSGRVFEAGRLRESVVRYDRSFIGPDRIRLDYSVEITDAWGRKQAPRRRAAVVPRAAITAVPELPVDAVCVEEVDPSSEPGPDLRPAPVLAESSASPPPQQEFVELIVADGQQQGFRLCTDDACEGLFRSQILHRDRTAWWVYPLLPFAGAVDLALMPLQVISLSPFFLLGD